MVADRVLDNWLVGIDSLWLIKLSASQSSHVFSFELNSQGKSLTGKRLTGLMQSS